MLGQWQLSFEETTQFHHVFHRGGDKWRKRPIGEGNGMTTAALLPASQAGGRSPPRPDSRRTNHRESLAFNSGRRPLLARSLHISFFGLTPRTVKVKETLKGEGCSVIYSPETRCWLLSQRERARIRTPCPLRVSAARLRACSMSRSPLCLCKSARGGCLARSTSWEFRWR